MRIVSLLPSATDTVCTLGLRDSLVGRTHECDWPPGVSDVTAMTRDVLATHEMSSGEIHAAVGGAVHRGSSIYALDGDALEAARPDLILTQELCEVCAVSYTEVEQAARLLPGDVQVVSLEPHSIDDILSHVSLVGRLCGVVDRADEVVADARARLRAMREPDRRPRVFCCEWLDPPFAAGHWVPEQVALAGGDEVLGPRGAPSPQTTWEDVIATEPEILVLMPCGMPIDRTMRELDAVPSIASVRQTWVVDASAYFNRPGPRVVRGAEILNAIFTGAEPAPDEAARVSRGRRRRGD